MSRRIVVRLFLEGLNRPAIDALVARLRAVQGARPGEGTVEIGPYDKEPTWTQVVLYGGPSSPEAVAALRDALAPRWLAAGGEDTIWEPDSQGPAHVAGLRWACISLAHPEAFVRPEASDS